MTNPVSVRYSLGEIIQCIFSVFFPLNGGVGIVCAGHSMIHWRSWVPNASELCISSPECCGITASLKGLTLHYGGNLEAPGRRLELLRWSHRNFASDTNSPSRGAGWKTQKCGGLSTLSHALIPIFSVRKLIIQQF